MNDTVEADLLMVPRSDSFEPKFVTGVLVQLHDGKAHVSVFLRDPKDSEQLCAIGQEIIRMLRPC